MLPPAGIDRVELPQLLTTVTIGAAGIAPGFASAEPGRLGQPLKLWVTVYVPAETTVMEAEVSPVLQRMDSPAGIDNVELPQLFTTVTTGVAGTEAGAAVPDPSGLVQPLIVCVTVYVPGVVTVIEVVISPVLHNIEPPAGIDKVELPQLSVTVTTGASGVATGAATPDPAALVQPSAVCETE